MGISRHPALLWVSTFFGAVTFGFGVNYVLDPRGAFSHFGFAHPEHEQELIDNIMVLYGVKDLFMGTSIWAATWLGNRRNAGVVLLATGLAAGVDGYVVKNAVGSAVGGEWNHWGYGPVVGTLGLVMLGLLG